MRKRIKSISLCLVLAFSVSTTVSFAAQGGSIGQGDISVMKGSQVVDQLKGQNPVQDSSMLVCDGKCMIKSEGISLVAADQAKFAIKNEADTFRLFLRSGSVDYVITEKARKIAFHTPEGVYSVADVIFNAGSDPVVRGTVTVTKDGKTEVSVKEGKLVFATADGMKTVNADEKIVLAISTPPAGGTPPPDDDNLEMWLWGGAAAAAIAAGIIIAENDDDDDGQVGGPVTEDEEPETGGRDRRDNRAPTPSPTPSPTPTPTPSPSA